MAQPVRPDDQGALADARDLVSARAGERGCHRGDPRRLQAAVRSGERFASGWHLVRVLLTRSAPATAADPANPEREPRRRLDLHLRGDVFSTGSLVDLTPKKAAGTGA